MNFLSMKYFNELSKKRNFTRAAENLHITQQTLSAHIAAIEEELNCKLFVRSTPLELTYEGTIFKKYAAQFEKLYFSLEKEFSDMKTDTRGLLRIGIAHTRSRIFMAGVIADFQREYPFIELQLIDGMNDVLLKKLMDEEIDLIIADLPNNIPGVEQQNIYYEEMFLHIPITLLKKHFGEGIADIISKLQLTHDLSLLSEIPFLLGYHDDIAGRIGSELISEAGFVPKIKVQSEDMGILLSLCALGEGACFCPDNLARSVLSEKQMSDLCVISLGKTARFPIKCGWKKQQYSWKILQNFVKQLSSSFSVYTR